MQVLKETSYRFSTFRNITVQMPDNTIEFQNTEDQELFNRIKKNSDKEAFNDLFRKYYKNLCLYSSKYINEIDSVEEVVQAFFVKLWENRSQININGSVKSYLYAAIRNRAFNYIRDHKKFVNDEGLQDAAQMHVEDEDFELKEKISKAIDMMPQQRQTVFKLCRFHQLSYKEIANKLGISRKTVENHMSMALKDMRIHLADYLVTLVIIIITSITQL